MEKSRMNYRIMCTGQSWLTEYYQYMRYRVIPKELLLSFNTMLNTETRIVYKKHVLENTQEDLRVVAEWNCPMHHFLEPLGLLSGYFMFIQIENHNICIRFKLIDYYNICTLFIGMDYQNIFIMFELMENHDICILQKPRYILHEVWSTMKKLCIKEEPRLKQHKMFSEFLLIHSDQEAKLRKCNFPQRLLDKKHSEQDFDYLLQSISKRAPVITLFQVNSFNLDNLYSLSHRTMLQFSNQVEMISVRTCIYIHFQPKCDNFENYENSKFIISWSVLLENITSAETVIYVNQETKTSLTYEKTKASEICVIQQSNDRITIPSDNVSIAAITDKQEAISESKGRNICDEIEGNVEDGHIAIHSTEKHEPEKSPYHTEDKVRQEESQDVSFRKETDISSLHNTFYLVKLKQCKHEKKSFKSGIENEKNEPSKNIEQKVFEGKVLKSDQDKYVRDATDYVKSIREITCLPPSSTIAPVKEAKVCMLSVEKQSSTNNIIRRQDSHVESDGQTVASGTTATTLTLAGTSVVQPSTADPAISTKIDLNNLDDVLRETALGRDKGPRVTMKFELLRLCTLRNYPKENKPYISRLAKAGFYYAANGDEVVCFCCGVRRSSWTANCDPMSTHQRLSPKCPFLTRNEEVNIPVPEEDDDDYNKFTLLEDLLQNPPPILDSDTHRGHSINGISAASEDNGAAPLVAPAKTGQPKQKRRYNKTPKNPHYAVKDVRQNSFQGWPAGHIISPKLLAECGFYYAGLEDCVRCFHCGIGLRHWAVEDDPWIEHSRWTLENPCYFLIQMKGEEYVDLVRLAVEITDNQPPQADSEQPPVEQPNSKEESSQGTGQTVVTSASSSNRDSSAVQSNTSSTAAGSTTHKGNKSEQKQLKMENERLRKQTYCTICAERNVCVVFLPCGHLVTCDHCAPTLSKCPTCRQVIKGTVKTYMS